MRTSDRVLLALGIFFVVFIAGMVLTFWRFGAVPDSLVQCTLGAGGVEALLLAAAVAMGVYVGLKFAAMMGGIAL